MIKYFIGGIYMQTYQIFFPMLLLACTGLFAQNVSLEQAVQSSAQTIESRLPQGSKAAVLAFTADSQKFSDYIIDELAIAIGNNNKVMVIDRQYTDVIRKELNIQMSGDVSDDDVKRVGIQLGAQFVITGSLVDIGNAYRFRVIAINVETAVRVAANPVNININDPQVVFLLTGNRTVQTNPLQQTSVPSGTSVQAYKIGDLGPGGGRIFYAYNGTYMECSRELGKTTNWSEAVTMTKNYPGGGFSDWRLPTLRELSLIYENLKLNNLGDFNPSGFYWSSNDDGNNVWGVLFDTGKQSNGTKGGGGFTRAVRIF
jgi:TolB-like protein